MSHRRHDRDMVCVHPSRRETWFYMPSPWKENGWKDPYTLTVEELLEEKERCRMKIKEWTKLKEQNEEEEKKRRMREMESAWQPDGFICGGCSSSENFYDMTIREYNQQLDVCQLFLRYEWGFVDTHAKPLLKELELLKVGDTKIRIIEEVAVDWEKLAYRLDFSDSVVRAIKENNSGKDERVESCCQDMLRRWLDERACQPVTWEKLVEAIRDIPRDTLAMQVEKFFA